MATRERRTYATWRAAGFSLLEVLVAFVILSLVATALFRLFSGALNNASAADDYSRAVLVAESALAEAAGRPLRETTLQGNSDDGRIAWTTRVEPYIAPHPNPDVVRASDSLQVRLYRVSTEVTFPSSAGGTRTIALSTMRLAAKDAR